MGVQQAPPVVIPPAPAQRPKRYKRNVEPIVSFAGDESEGMGTRQLLRPKGVQRAS